MHTRFNIIFFAIAVVLLSSAARAAAPSEWASANDCVNRDLALLLPAHEIAEILLRVLRVDCASEIGAAEAATVRQLEGQGGITMLAERSAASMMVRKMTDDALLACIVRREAEDNAPQAP